MTCVVLSLFTHQEMLPITELLANIRQLDQSSQGVLNKNPICPVAIRICDLTFAFYPLFISIIFFKFIHKTNNINVTYLLPEI